MSSKMELIVMDDQQSVSSHNSSNSSYDVIDEKTGEVINKDFDNLKIDNGLDNVPLNSDGMTTFFTNDDKMKGSLTDWNNPPNKDDEILSVAVVGKEQRGKFKMIDDNFFDGKLQSKDRESSESVSSSKSLVDWGYSPRHRLLVFNTVPQSPVTSKLITNRVIYSMMACSDVLIYYVKANDICEEVCEFLHHFLNCYSKYFSPLFQRIKKDGRKMSTYEPQIIIYKATPGNWIIPDNEINVPFDVRVRNFAKKCGFPLSFSNEIQFASVDDEKECLEATETERAEKYPNTLLSKIKNIYVGESRPLRTVDSFCAMAKNLHKVYSGSILPCSIRPYPDNLFSCHRKCTICYMTCDRATNHKESSGYPELKPATEGTIFSPHHHISSNCQYRKETANRRYRCKKCEQTKGIKTSILSIVPGSMYWRANVHCPNCGDLGPKAEDGPSSDIAITEDIHNWSDEENVRYTNTAQGTRTLLENVSSSLQNVTNLVAPQQTNCMRCKKELSNATSQCTGCKYLYCNTCTVVSGAGRMCLTCKERAPQAGLIGSFLSTAYDYTYTASMNATIAVKGAVTSYVNPEYWENDQDVKHCNVCKTLLDINSVIPDHRIHHCRACGKGVCNTCSLNLARVPEKGFPELNRCCNSCFPNREEGRRARRNV